MKKTLSIPHFSKVAIVILCLAMLLTACGGTPAPSSNTQASTQEVKEPVRFIAAQAADIQKLIPFQTTDAISGLVINLISEGLLSYEDDYKLVTRLAESYKFSDDFLSLTFTLHDNITFHNGTPLTSADVKFTYEEAMSDLHGSNQTKEYEFIESIETPDDLTVVFNFHYIYGPTLNRMTMAIICKSYCEDEGFLDNNYSAYSIKAIGTGPYKISDWLVGDRLTLVANTDYWQGKPEVDEVVIRVIPDNTVRLQAFERGEIDFIFGVPVEEVDALAEQSDKFTVLSYPQLRFYYMTWNTQTELFKDLALRQALTLATDKDTIISTLLNNHAQKSITPYAPNHPYYNNDLEEVYPFDLEKAAQVLADAGYTMGDDGILINPGGLRCSFETMVPSNAAQSESIALLLKEWYKTIGVELNLVRMDVAQIYDIMDAVIAGKAPEDTYVSMMGSMGTGIDPDMTRYMHTKGGLNDYRYSNSEVDALLDKGVKLVNIEDRKPIYHEIQTILAADLPCLMIYFPESNNAVSNKFEGMTATPNGQVSLLHRVTVKK